MEIPGRRRRRTRPIADFGRSINGNGIPSLAYCFCCRSFSCQPKTVGRCALSLATTRTPFNRDRKSTRLNSVTNAHLVCRLLLEKKKQEKQNTTKNIDCKSKKYIHQMQ